MSSGNIHETEYEESTFELEEKLYSFQLIENFDDMQLKEELLRGVYTHGFEKPSMIQQKAIIPLTSGRDIIAQAQSGTGKTATFTIGLLQRVDSDLHQLQAIVLCPVRELAYQTTLVIESIGCHMGLKIGSFVGGTKVDDDVKEINEGVQVVTACPGRLIHLLHMKALDLRHLICFIIDEADEMLSLGFKDDIHEIYSVLPHDCQICLFSATMPKGALEMTSLFMKNPLQILIKQEEVRLDGIRQYYIDSGNGENKIEIICDLYDTINIAQSIIFCNTKKRVVEVTEELRRREFPVSCSHGELYPHERRQVLRDFKNGRSRVLVSTDLLGRGIDVHGVSLVINFEMPLQFEKYVHRIGRAGRFGRKGVALNLVANKEVATMLEYEKLMSTHIIEMPEDIAQYVA